ncbi:MAG: tetratricopeptide repeat protein [Polyangia bacterium]
MALSQLGRHDDVLQEMRLAIAGDPRSAPAWRLRADSLLAKGDVAQALTAAKQARELDPNDPTIADLLSVIVATQETGFVGALVESTGTKEYPARDIGKVKWRESTSVATHAPDDGAVTDPDISYAISSAPFSTRQELDEVPGPFDEVFTRLDPEPGSAPQALDDDDDDPLSSPFPILHSAGPEEMTMLGAPLGTAPSPKSRRDQETVERPLPARDLAEGKLPTSAHTMLAPKPGPAVPTRAEQQTADSSSGDQSTRRRPRATPIAVPDQNRVTRPVEKMDTSIPIGFSSPIETTDPSISLSSNEVVFVPEPSSGGEVPIESGQVMLDDSLDLRDVSLDESLHALDADPLTTPERPRAAPARPRPVAPPPRSEAIPSYSPMKFTPAPRRAVAYDPRAEITKPPASHQPSGDRGMASPSLLSRAVESLPFSHSRSGRSPLMTLAALFAGSVALAVIVGLVIREVKLRSGVARRYDMAQKKLATGNFAGYQAAELLYRQILSDRDDPRAAVLRAKVLSQLAFEFGEPPDAAQRALDALPKTSFPEQKEARIYLALAKGELDVALRQAVALLKERPGPQARYLVGEAYLLLDQPEDAGAALLTASAEDPQNAMVLHGLGLAEAAMHHTDRAFDAYGRALAANANHVATIIDRALLQLREGIDRDAAAGSLEGVVGKLVADSSPGQLARAYVGLAEIELQKGNVAAARSALSSAAARRRDHPLLLEELAQAYADAFELDPAEREAKRALQVSDRITARLILAEVALRRSRPVQALTVLEESGSSRPQVLVLRALAKLDLGRNGEARTDAELATHLDPSSVAAAVALARVDIAEGKYDSAQRRLEALEAQGKHAEVAWALGQVYLARHQPDRARTYFRSALLRQPLLLEARLALARLLHDAGDLPEARDEVNRVLAVNAAYVPARRELASIALDLGDAIAARDELDALVDRDGDIDTLLGGARAHLLLGDAKGAEERADRAMRMHPSGPDLEAAVALKARALLLAHRPNDAILALLTPTRTAAHGELVALLITAYLDYNRLDWAQRAIDVAPLAARNGVELTLARARLALAEGRQQAARGLVADALLRLRTGRAPTWLRAEALGLEGQTELELGQAKVAVKSLRSSLELDPRAAHVQHELGLAYLDLRRIPEASAAFEAATLADPKLAESQYYLGWSRRAVGDRRGDDALRAYLALEPHGAVADDARRLLAGGEVTQTSDRPRNRRKAPRR